MTDVQKLTSWTYQRQLLGRRGSNALDALRTVIAVYSTHPTAPLALLARSNRLSRSEFQALEQTRKVVRIVAMRGSAFMLPTETAARVFAATRVGQEQLDGILRPRGLDAATYTRLTSLVLECCSKPVTPSELRNCAGTDEDVYMVARVLARYGRVLRVGASLRTDQLKYVATGAWLGHELEPLERAGALTWLAGEYLRAFGPTREVDFAWWAGVPRRAAQAALAHVETTERDGFLMLAEDGRAFDRLQPMDPDAVDVLPKWDSYTMAYAPDGRQRLIDDRFLSLAYTSVTGSPGATSGDGLPLVLRGGRAIATWSHRFEGQRLMVTVSPFENDRVSPSAFDAVGELLSASAVSVA
jgi:hypothetical protein